ncbi:MAG: phage tail assembly protein [Deltaproteobacteria bacterium]|nr:phage tail assembly protein [Deltaproteobacteria bacterium]
MSSIHTVRESQTQNPESLSEKNRGSEDSPYKVIELQKPIYFGGEKISKIEFIQPKTKHLKGIPIGSPTFGDLLVVASRVSGLPLQVFEELSMPDGAKVVQVVNSFLEKSPPTGESV